MEVVMVNPGELRLTAKDLRESAKRHEITPWWWWWSWWWPMWPSSTVDKGLLNKAAKELEEAAEEIKRLRPS
jgi:hypothetical protein